jgi:PDZ domain
MQVCYGRPQEAEEQVVLLSQVLACDATVGYEDVSNVEARLP